MISRFLLASVAVAAVSCNQQPSTFLSSDSDLTVGKSTERRSLKTHVADTFKLSLSPGAFVYGSANQISVDVVVQVFRPGGRKVATFDSPARGPEFFDFETDTAGNYSLVISPFEENIGDYELVINGVEKIPGDAEGRISQYVRASTGSNDGPGASVAVQQDGKIIYSGGFGHADLEHDVHNSGTTVYHIASVSKQFTAFAIAMLADQGKLSVDDDIRKYLPEMYDFGTPITINHLVHHTSGLRDQWDLLLMAGWRLDDVITQKQIMRVVSRQRELNFKPGDEMLYCNTGFTLMAEIVSRVSGKPFPEWCKENIFDPLEMRNTIFYDDHERVVYNRAYSYQMGSDGNFRKSVLSYANAGATSLFTTVEDLSRWAMNFDNIKVGNERVMEMMNRRFVLNKGDTTTYAFGQVHGKYKGLPTISHGGADAAYRTYFVRFPEQKLSISVFSNLGSFNTGGLAFRIADLYLADAVKPDPARASTPSSPHATTDAVPFDPASVKLADFIGRYYSPELETTYTLTVMNDTLVATHQRHDDFRLKAESTDEFSSDGFLGNLTFTRDKSKRVTGMLSTTGRVRKLRFERQ